MHSIKAQYFLKRFQLFYDWFQSIPCVQKKTTKNKQTSKPLLVRYYHIIISRMFNRVFNNS